MDCNLNWNEITPDIIIGSCPMTAEDIEIIVQSTGISAILSVQTDQDISYYGIDAKTIVNKTNELGIKFIRVPMKDFNINDQQDKLLDAVNALAGLISDKHKVYVHCTAGINRSPLTVLGYMCFVQKMPLHAAFKLLRHKRVVCEPYMDVFVACLQKLDNAG